MTREALTPQAAVERLADRVVDRFARPAEVERDAVFVGPAIEHLRDKLGPIIYPDGLGAPRDDAIRAIVATTCSPLMP